MCCLPMKDITSMFLNDICLHILTYTVYFKAEPKVVPSGLKNRKKISRDTKSTDKTLQAVGASSSGENVDAQKRLQVILYLINLKVK